MKHEKVEVDMNNNEKPEVVDNNDYSVEMIEAMFADSLSRGMQNAIVSQQNAQMASSASITSACARILESRAETKNPSDCSETGVNSDAICTKDNNEGNTKKHS